jgi:CubicO group peptidase (beta-lactamase class C family)
MNRELLTQRFAENFERFGELGASVSVWRRGEPLLNLGQGVWDSSGSPRWTTKTPVLIWSATKALTSTCLLVLCDRLGLKLDRRVTDFWPEYSGGGKATTTLRHVLAHQSGQAALRDRSISVLDHTAVAAALAAQEPFWSPGDGHGYHARTYGFLVDELVRRLSGITLGQFFRREIRDPLELDLWIGLPPELADQVAPIHAPRKKRASSFEDPFYERLAQPDSLARAAFSTPTGLQSPSMLNAVLIRQQHELASFGAIGTAESLAKFYAIVWLEPGFLTANTWRLAQTTVGSGIDRVLNLPTAFSSGFMQDPVNGNGQKQREIMGPNQAAFGQPGAGGSHAFCDPAAELSFAYVMNQMEPGVFPNQKSLRLVECLYADGV